MKFVSRPRHYESADGTWLNGVTTVCDMFPKFLLPWATRVNADWAIKELDNKWSDGNTRLPDVVSIIEQSKIQYENVRDEAAGKGTSAHGIIEEYIKTKSQSLVMPVPCDGDVYNCVKAFIEWEKSNNVKWIASELMVCNIDIGIAGTLDAIAEVNGVVTLVDFKTNKAIYPQSMYSQTAAYWMCLKYQLEDIKQIPTERMILRLPKDGSKFEAHKILSPLEIDWKMFMTALDMYNGTKHYKQYSGEKKYGK